MNCLYLEKDQHLLFAGSQSGMFAQINLRNYESKVITYNDKRSDGGLINTITGASGPRIVMATEDGLRIWNYNKETFEHYKNQPPLGNFIWKGAKVSSTIQCPDL